MTTCPKCAYTRKPEDTAPEWECPECGVIYAKAQPAPTPRPRRVEPIASPTPVPTPDATPAQAPTAQAPTAQAPTAQAPLPSKEAPPPAAKTAKSCPECDGRISPRASLCPHCGEPLSFQRSLAVAVRDIEMPFGSMVNFMVKWALASIPAIILIILIGFIPMLLLGGIIKAAGN